MIAAILATLLCQISPDEPVAEPPSPIGDYAFVAAVEHWVYDSTRANKLESYVTDRQARLIRMLGCNHHGCRVEASEQLAAMGPDARRALILGTRHKDPEVRNRCEALLDGRHRCGTCGGTGRCAGLFPMYEYGDCHVCGHSRYNPSFPDLGRGSHRCRECMGTGDPPAYRFDAPREADPFRIVR